MRTLYREHPLAAIVLGAIVAIAVFLVIFTLLLILGGSGSTSSG